MVNAVFSSLAQLSANIMHRIDCDYTESDGLMRKSRSWSAYPRKLLWIRHSKWLTDPYILYGVMLYHCRDTKISGHIDQHLFL